MGPSLDRIAERLGVDLVGAQTQLYNAAALSDAMGKTPHQRGLVSADPACPALIVGVSAATIDAVARFVVDAWGSDPACRLLDQDVDGEPPTEVTLGELRGSLAGDSDGDIEWSIWVPAADAYRAGRSMDTLERIVARLRAPGGCPWDREQTTASLRLNAIDEAYEVVDAIDAGDDANLAEELGDVLMAVALQAQIAEDGGRFTLADVYERVNTKLVRRHPHVFGDVVVSGTDDIVANWNRIKADEKAEAGRGAADPLDPLARFPVAMPALTVVARLVGKGQWPGDVFIDPFGPGDQAEEAADWYARRLAAGADPEAELRDAVRRLLTADHALRFRSSPGERTEEWSDEEHPRRSHDDRSRPENPD